MIGRGLAVPLLLSGALLVAACADGSGSAELPADTSSATARPSPTVSDSLATDATASTTVPETTDADSSSSIELDALGVVAPGAYTSDVLPLSLDVTTTDSFRLERAHPGMIEIVSLASSPEAYRGVALMVVDTLIDTDAVGRHLSRTAAGSDLDEYLRSRDRMVILDRRTEVLGGLEADVWRVGFTDPCGDCWYPVLFNTTGFRNQWGHPPGYVQEYWSIDAPGAPIIVAVEAPEDSFDAWNEQVHEHFFAGLRFGSPSGYSPALPPVPSGTSLDGFGPHGIGRAELEVVDASRPTSEVSDERGLLVPSSDERRLLPRVPYAWEAGGFGAEPADGSFPLVVVAPALFDASISLPAERQLASHGFVVVTVRFPESSFPGNAVFGVPQQPADVSFVIDEIERGALPADLAAITDVERIGLIGHSGGATTGFGLLAYDCCQDPRIDAIVAHAGTPFDFGSVRLANIAPILHVVSDGDQQISVDAIRAFHEATDGPSTFAVMEGARHLEWLDPQSSQYDATFELVSTFLDQHLRGGQADLGVVADTSVFAEIDQRWNVTAAGSPVRTPTRRSPGRRRRP